METSRSVERSETTETTPVQDSAPAGAAEMRLKRFLRPRRDGPDWTLNPTARQQLNHEQNEGDDEDEVNQPTGDVEAEAERPHDD